MICSVVFDAARIARLNVQVGAVKRGGVGQKGHGFSLKFKLQIIINKIKVRTFSASGVLIVLDFEQTTCVMCLCWWGEGEGGVSLQILILLNFINIAERRSFFATLQASDVPTIYVMLIAKNRPVERSVVIIPYDAQLHAAAKTSLF